MARTMSWDRWAVKERGIRWPDGQVSIWKDNSPFLVGVFGFVKKLGVFDGPRIACFETRDKARQAKREKGIIGSVVKIRVTVTEEGGK